MNSEICVYIMVWREHKSQTGQVTHPIFRSWSSLFTPNPPKSSQEPDYFISSSSYPNSTPLENSCLEISGCFCCSWEGMKHFLSLSPVHKSQHPGCLCWPYHTCSPSVQFSAYTVLICWGYYAESTEATQVKGNAAFFPWKVRQIKITSTDNLKKITNP